MGDVRAIELPRQSDSVRVMFAVLGYQTSSYDVKSALNKVRRHLRSVLGEGDARPALLSYATVLTQVLLAVATSPLSRVERTFIDAK